MQNNIDIEKFNLNEIKERIPDQDYINSSFDYSASTPVTDILIIFSTPRSGSTLLCDLLYKNNICIPHEYFQIDDYLPLLAERWSCIDNNKVNAALLVERLIKKRTSAKGWLGINLHGEHLSLFSSFKSLFPEANYHYVHITRQNNFSQAISYEMAIQTGKWSSHFKTDITPEYSFKGIKNKLARLSHQNNLISTYIIKNNLKCEAVSYENLVKAPKEQLKQILPQSLLDDISTESNLKKQSSSLNEEWLNTFCEEYFNTDGNGYTPENQTPQKKGIKKFLNLNF